ncbi:6-carboxytetrahydropterin synthase QueD [bacterium]|nr:6-carboxytetrahydropterin synthase QueD [bacterium]
MKKKPIVAISKRFSFDAAHQLTGVPDGHPCGELHGHSYSIEVEVKDAIDPGVGWVIDYREIKRVVQPLVDQLDHKFLNDVDGLEYTTAEDIAAWFWEKIKPKMPQLTRISVMETPTNRCDFYGEYRD